LSNPRVYLFIKNGDTECENTRKIIEDSGIPLKIIDVEKNNVQCSMWFDVGSGKVPILVTNELVISGLNYIKPYIQKKLDSLQTDLFF